MCIKAISQTDSPENEELVERILELCHGHSHEDTCKAWYMAFALAGRVGFSTAQAESIARESPELDTLASRCLELINGHSYEELCIAISKTVYGATVVEGVFCRHLVPEKAPFATSDCDNNGSPRVNELIGRMLDVCDGFTHGEISQATASVCGITGKKGVYFRGGAAERTLAAQIQPITASRERV